MFSAETEPSTNQQEDTNDNDDTIRYIDYKRPTARRKSLKSRIGTPAAANHGNLRTGSLGGYI